MTLLPIALIQLTFVILGGYLTLPIVFSTLALLQQLRLSIGRQWTRAIETGEVVATLIHPSFFSPSPQLLLPSFLTCFLP